MRFVVTVPHEIRSEANYVLDWILSDRFGLPQPVIETHDAPQIILSFPGTPETISFPCLGGWSPEATSRFHALPRHPAEARNELPILFANRQGEGGTALSFDFWGTIFWFLARVEELETDIRDRHGRFAAAQSYLKRRNLLLRPVIDEYVEWLWERLLAIWPGLTRKIDHPTVRVTCDVDNPFSRSLRGPFALMRGLVGDFALRHSPAAALNTLRNAWRAKYRGDYSLDPNNRFGWIMDQCEALGLRAAFYFICGNHPVDPRYDLDHPFVRNLMHQIHERGHEIGMHGSYVTYQDTRAVAKEFANLQAACASLGITPPAYGNRQHYLRWDMRITPDALADAGFAYDTTLGFSDHAGFRCGTSHEFPLWSWPRRAPLTVRERPLIAMESTLFEPGYMNLSPESGLEVMLALKRTCRQFGGDFVLLWHNSYFHRYADRLCYTSLLKE